MVRLAWADQRFARKGVELQRFVRARSRDATGLEELSVAVRAGLMPAEMVHEQYPRDFVVACARGVCTELASYV